MKRRHLILSALMAIPAVSFARFRFLKKDKPAIRAKKGFIIRADESRFHGEQKKVEHDRLRCVVSCEDSDGGLLIGTTTSKSLIGKGGPPLHLHEHQDEILYVASGEFLIQIGEEIIKVKTGDAAFIPRGTHHTFANPVVNNPGTLISIFQPGNKQMEADFKTIASGNFPKSWENDPTIVGPPIKLN
ncbi:cupin domain-containing protein [Dyadobacter sp. CY345]|uniref:cupin domain-containing protein n=1 Tax=Dyadobacter sp. CY345 TaxID=2909335 RepID=UPI001F45799F|nr:cupin domain-containing protein [Dyadobacter sp. CY345]MCF2443320.1 cupin domain-containing protein [Dyadobacter sp. CY345]